MDTSILTAQELGRLVPTVDMGVGTEKRAFVRFPFTCVQRLNHDIDCGVRDLSRFYAVRCRDISQSGISFFLPTCPTFRCAVIELGKPSMLSYWAISVVRAMQQDDGTHVVGCSFIRRIEQQ